MKRPRHLFSEWDAIRRRVGRHRRVALFSDFDGTLAPIRSRPEQVKLSARTRLLLRRIAAGGVRVGVISGRPLDDVKKRVRLGGIWYVGAHGAHLEDPAGLRHSRVGPQHRAAIAQVRQWLQPRLAVMRGVWLEDKEVSLAVHYRGASPRSAEFVELLVCSALSERPGLYLMPGKKVWEILPDERLHKWAALDWILRREAHGGYRRWLTFYLGDDVTDERVFEKLPGISVAVGKSSGTHARYFLKDWREVSRLLERWNELR